MYVNLKKSNKKWIWLSVERYSQNIKGFFVGAIDNSAFENLSKNIEHIDEKIYATDARDSYSLINPKKHITGKSNTYTVERTNRLLRYYLARFARKIYSVSKPLDMIFYSLYLFCFCHLFSSIFF